MVEVISQEGIGKIEIIRSKLQPPSTPIFNLPPTRYFLFLKKGSDLIVDPSFILSTDELMTKKKKDVGWLLTDEVGELPDKWNKLVEKTRSMAEKVIAESPTLSYEEKKKWLKPRITTKDGKEFSIIDIASYAISRGDFLITSGFLNMSHYFYAMSFFVFRLLAGEEIRRQPASQGSMGQVFDKYLSQMKPIVETWEAFFKDGPWTTEDMIHLIRRRWLSPPLANDQKTPLDFEPKKSADIEERKMMLALLELAIVAEWGDDIEASRELAKQDPVFSSAYLMSIVGMIESMKYLDDSERDFKEEIRTVNGLALVMASEAPPDEINPLSAQNRMFFSRAVVLARDVYARRSMPWLFNFGNRVLGENKLTGVKDAGKRMYFFNQVVCLHEIDELSRWYYDTRPMVTITGEEEREVVATVSGKERMTVVEPTFKSVWGLMESVINKNIQEFDEGRSDGMIVKINELAKEYFTGQLATGDFKKYDLRFGQSKLVMMRLNWLMAEAETDPALKAKIKPILEELEKEMIKIKDLSRTRVLVAENHWQSLEEAIAALRKRKDLEINVLLATADEDGRTIEEHFIPYQKIKKARALVEVDEEDWQKVMLKWVKRKEEENGDAYVAIFVTGRSDFGIGKGEAKVPFEIQFYPWGAAKANWGHRMKYKVKV